MKKLFLGLLLVFSTVYLVSCNKTNNTSSSKETTNSIKNENVVTDKKTLETEVNNQNQTRGKDTVKVEISVKDYGKINLDIYKDVAPITSDNFINLVKNGFYDGLTFHRIIKGFMIQGGDPLGNGTGGSDQRIKGEFAANGVQNNLSHKRGVISMARSNHPDSASSQFFIMHEDGEFLDGNYAAFGEVTSGIEVVDAICDKVKPIDNNGTVPKDDQPVIEYIKIVE